jgi:hypothetical protein
MAQVGGFTKRQIDVIFRLGGSQTFMTQQGNTAKGGGLRVEATITKAGSVGMPTLTARIYGLTQDIATSVSTLGTVYGALKNNQIELQAGDENGKTSVFLGIIDTAYTDYEDPANPALEVRAHTGLLEATRGIPPSSFTGPTDVAVIIAGLANQIGWQFENNGVSVILRGGLGGGPYFSGTAREQILKAARQAHIHGWMDADPSGSQVVAIWPWDGVRNSAPALISKDTGMVGYPAWEQNALRVKSEFNPSIATSGIGPGGILIGGTIMVKSIVPNATGIWQVFSVTHELDSNVEDGRWFTTARCINTKWPNPGDNVGIDTQ